MCFSDDSRALVFTVAYLSQMIRGAEGCAQHVRRRRGTFFKNAHRTRETRWDESLLWITERLPEDRSFFRSIFGCTIIYRFFKRPSLTLAHQLVEKENIKWNHAGSKYYINKTLRFLTRNRNTLPCLHRNSRAAMRSQQVSDASRGQRGGASTFVVRQN